MQTRPSFCPQKELSGAHSQLIILTRQCYQSGCASWSSVILMFQRKQLSSSPAPLAAFLLPAMAHPSSLPPPTGCTGVWIMDPSTEWRFRREIIGRRGRWRLPTLPSPASTLCLLLLLLLPLTHASNSTRQLRGHAHPPPVEVHVPAVPVDGDVGLVLVPSGNASALSNATATTSNSGSNGTASGGAAVLPMSGVHLRVGVVVDPPLVIRTPAAIEVRCP